MIAITISNNSPELNADDETHGRKLTCPKKTKTTRFINLP